MAKTGPKPGTRQPIGDRLERSSKVDPATDCWVWQLAKNNLGYGLMRDTTKMRMRTAHRISYEHYNDTIIPKDMCVCHTCDNPSCINPQHLWLGTRKDNVADMERKGRHMYWGKPDWTGIPKPRKNCIHCGASMPITVINRYHNDKCKHKP